MLKKLVFTIALLIPLAAFSQDETPNVVVGPISKEQKAAEKKREKQKEIAEKAEKKGARQLYKMQSKETRRRIRRDRKEAERVNHNQPKKGFFLFRPFKKKHH